MVKIITIKRRFRHQSMDVKYTVHQNQLLIVQLSPQAMLILLQLHADDANWVNLMGNVPLASFRCETR